MWTSRDELKNIQLGNRTIEEIDKGKLLSITCDNKLTMDDHIKHICKQASNKLYVGRRTYFDVSQHLSGVGSSPAGSLGRDLKLQKLQYKYLTTSVKVVLVVRGYFNG